MSNQNMKDILHKIWPYFPYLLFVTFLTFGAMPLTDEAWYTYPALTFLREGQILDVRWCQPQRGQAFTMETTSLVYALWYTLGGINIVWGRMLGVIGGLLFLITLNECFRIVRVPAQARKVAIGVSGVSYFFLISTAQIRPEGLTLFASSMSLYMYLRWQDNTESFSKLILAHVFIIFAALLHWQAAFAGMALWFSSFLLNRQEIDFKRTVCICSLYILSMIIVYFSYVHSLQDEFIVRMDWLLTKSGHGGGLHPHAGGMIAACIRYLETSQYGKLLAAVGMVAVIGIGIAAFWNKDKGRKVLSIYAFSCYVSWVATTYALDDFHACWLVPAFMMIIIVGYESFKSPITIKSMFGGLMIVPVLLSVFGCMFAVRTIYYNPRVNIYECDLKSLESEFHLRNATVFGEREIMWFFKFDPGITFPVSGTAEYFIGPVLKAPDSKTICNNDYVLIKKERRFALYRRLTMTNP